MTLATSTNEMLQAALYQRVSTKDQSIDRQNDANRAAADAHGWQAAEYKDKVSASRFAGSKGGANREDWRRLLAGITTGQVDVLVLWESSRGDRQLAGWATLLDSCRRHGVLIHITSEGTTYNPAVARDWKALAEAGIDSAYESEKLSMRIGDGKAAGRRAGRPQGSVAYGVHRVRDPEKTRHAFVRDEPDPATAPVVRRIILSVGRGDSYQAIADALSNEGIPSPQGGQWKRIAITRIAGNPVYADAGIVTGEESLKARDRLADTRRKGERPATMRFRYSQVMHCAVCGGNVRGATVRGAGRYACVNGHTAIKADKADEFLDRVAISRLSQPDAMDLFGRADESAVRAAEAEVTRLRLKLAAAAQSFSADRITIEQMEQITADVQPKLAAAQRRAKDAAVPAPLLGLPGGGRAAVAKRWHALTLSARKAAIRCLMPDVKLCPGRARPVDERIIPWPDPV